MQGRRNAVYWHILQTHRAAEVAFNRYVQLFDPSSRSLLWAKKPNESEKTVFLTGGRTVTFQSGENYQDLRVETLDGAIIDECRQQHKELWTQVLRSMFARNKGWCHFYSTPNGFDWFYDLYNEALSYPEEWGALHAPSTSAWWWTPEEIESAKRTMSEAEFSQEILAEFRDITAGRAYPCFGEYNFSKTNPFYTNGLFHPQLPLGIALDFNLSPMAWTIGQKKVKQFYWFDEVWLKSSHTQEAADVLCNKILLHQGEALAREIGIILIGDATSKAGQRAAGKSDYDIVCQSLDSRGIKWTNLTPDANPRVKDRVNTVNAHLKDATGKTNCHFHPTGCPHAVKDFRRVLWKEGTGGAVLDQKKDPDLTHSSDGIGYFIHATSPLVYDEIVPAMRVIRRV